MLMMQDAVHPLSAWQVQIHENHYNGIKYPLNCVTFSSRNSYSSPFSINLRISKRRISRWHNNKTVKETCVLNISNIAEKVLCPHEAV